MILVLIVMGCCMQLSASAQPLSVANRMGGGEVFGKSHTCKSHQSPGDKCQDLLGMVRSCCQSMAHISHSACDIPPDLKGRSFKSFFGYIGCQANNFLTPWSTRYAGTDEQVAAQEAEQTCTM